MNFTCYKDDELFILNVSYKSSTFEYSEDYIMKRDDLEKFKKVYEDPEYSTEIYIYDKHLSDNFVSIMMNRNYIEFENCNCTDYAVKDRGIIRINKKGDVTRCLKTIIKALETGSASTIRDIIFN